MKIADWLKEATKQLSESGIDSARLDALILAEDVLEKNRAWLLAHDETLLTYAQISQLQTLLAKRSRHIPIAYLRGWCEFYGRSFYVNEDVLIPRPESEELIELYKQIPHAETIHVIDVGTGSGALGITAYLERPGASVTLLDIDEKCLDVARKNAAAQGTLVTILQSDLLAASTSYKNAIILANLPYVPKEYALNRAAQQEPASAIFGGIDGLDLYRRLLKQITATNSFPQHIITECLLMQQPALTYLFGEHGYTLHRSNGLGQHFIVAKQTARIRQQSH